MFNKLRPIFFKYKHLMYFAKYLIIFSCLFMLIYFLIFSRMEDLHRDHIIDSHYNNLNRGVTLLDSSIDSLIALDNLISEDSTYSTLFYANKNVDGHTCRYILICTHRHADLADAFIRDRHNKFLLNIK